MARHGVTEFLHIFEDVGATFFDIESDVLVVLDAQGNIERTNPAFERVIGYAESDVLGSELVHLVDTNDLAVFIKSFNWLPQPEPFRMLRRGGGKVSMRLVAARFRGQRGYLVLRQA